jgi:hypothetical protein
MQITLDVADLLRERYKKLYEVVALCRARESTLERKGRVILNDILNEKIIFEKVKLEEADELKALHRLEQELDSAQKVWKYLIATEHILMFC